MIQKPLRQDQFDLGFNMRYFAGADAALGAAKGGIGYPPAIRTSARTSAISTCRRTCRSSPRAAWTSRFGRMNTIIGYNGFLAPYRPFYSSDYQFFYSQDGAFTGFLTDLHVSNRLDIWNGMTLGANTFFTIAQHDSYCYIGQVNYWLTDEQRTRLTASVYAGPNAIFAARSWPATTTPSWSCASSRTGASASPRSSSRNMGWDANTPVGTGSWYGLYTIGIFHLSTTVDILVRAEWFDDVKGTRTGIDTNYSEVTLGLNWHPLKWLEIRPEIRGDFAGAPAFGVERCPYRSRASCPAGSASWSSSDGGPHGPAGRSAAGRSGFSVSPRFGVASAGGVGWRRLGESTSTQELGGLARRFDRRSPEPRSGEEG